MYIVMGVDWRLFGFLRCKRFLGFVILDDGIFERILVDVKEFIVLIKWYIDRGMLLYSY